jgi:hypothetical protein
VWPAPPSQLQNIQARAFCTGLNILGARGARAFLLKNHTPSIVEHLLVESPVSRLDSCDELKAVQADELGKTLHLRASPSLFDVAIDAEREILLGHS